MAARNAYPQNPTFHCLSNHRRREILRALTTWRPPLSEQQLAAYLTASNHESPTVRAPVPDEMRIELEHRHLPALKAAGLITWNRDEGAVETTTHPAFGDPRFERLLEIRSEDADDVFSSLAHDYRRIVLTVLQGAGTPVSRATLAQQIRQLSPDEVNGDTPDVETLTLALHHIHLPKLDENEFLDYDPSAGDITAVSHPVVADVFSIIYERETPTIERVDGFFDGLADAYRRARSETRTEVEWPHFWRVPHRG